jgi:PTS system ascorbate-specific IIA component
MIGVLLVAHNGLGNSLVDCVRHVMGSVPPNLKVLSVLGEDDPQSKETEGRALIEQLDAGKGVLILCDVFGATPSNIALRLQQKGRVQGVAGVNLPMLLRVVVCSQDRTLDEMTQRALEGGRDCIVLMNSETKDCNVATRCTDN